MDFNAELETFTRRLLGGTVDPRLQEAMLYSLLSPGKRLRPRSRLQETTASPRVVRQV
jgi:geranylgeranyl pyrophosphate synthase